MINIATFPWFAVPGPLMPHSIRTALSCRVRGVLSVYTCDPTIITVHCFSESWPWMDRCRTRDGDGIVLRVMPTRQPSSYNGGDA